MIKFKSKSYFRGERFEILELQLNKGKTLMQMNEWNCLVSNKTLWLVRRVFVDFSNEILRRCNVSWFRFNVTAENRKPELKWQITGKKMIFRTLRDRRCVRWLRFPLKWQQTKPEVKLTLQTRLIRITSVQRKKGIPRLGLINKKSFWCCFLLWTLSLNNWLPSVEKLILANKC